VFPVTLASEDVIGLVIDDFPGDVAQAAHGVDGDEAPSIASISRSAGMPMIAFDFSATWPRTRRGRTAKADTIRTTACPFLLSADLVTSAEMLANQPTSAADDREAPEPEPPGRGSMTPRGCPHVRKIIKI
jgi:hypothetical protein